MTARDDAIKAVMAHMADPDFRPSRPGSAAAVVDAVWPIAQAAALRDAARRIDGFGDANWYADEPHGRLRLNQAAMLRDQADQIEQGEP